LKGDARCKNRPADESSSYENGTSIKATTYSYIARTYRLLLDEQGNL
jgi:hypothetical protein